MEIILRRWSIYFSDFVKRPVYPHYPPVTILTLEYMPRDDATLASLLLNVFNDTSISLG